MRRRHSRARPVIDLQQRTPVSAPYLPRLARTPRRNRKRAGFFLHSPAFPPFGIIFSFLCQLLVAGLAAPLSLAALDLPPLTTGVNDLARMMPKVSHDELADRLRRFKTETGKSVVVLTLADLTGEDLAALSDRAFASLGLPERELKQAVLLVVARRNQKVAVRVGAELQALFPEPWAEEKLQAQVASYFNGMRSDLGVHAAVHYIFGVLRGDFRADRITESEEFEIASKGGAGAGALFSIALAPFLAFFVGMLWGVYASSMQREARLFIGAVLGGGTAKLVATLMALLGGYRDALWYFILISSILLGLLGSLTEYWMAGEWSGIPRIKDRVRRKPEDNMGI